MVPLLPIAVGGGVLATGIALRKRRKTPRLITALDGQQPARFATPYLQGQVMTRLTAIDERYQYFVQKHIDPLLGKERHTQLQEMLSDESPSLSREERFANRHMALGVGTLGIAILGHLVFTPLLALASLLGLAAMSGFYYLAWMLWKMNRRFGAAQLMCIYIAFLWLGGYVAIGSLGMVLVGFGYKIKSVTENNSRKTLINVFQLQPTSVWVRSNGYEIEIPFEQLQIGDTLVLQAGQVVPVDGTITDGVANIDQHMLTGEAQPVEKTGGDSILASTVLLSGKVDIHVEKTGSETTAGQIGEILNQSSQHNISVGLKIYELADRFALPTIALSAVSFPFIGPAGAVSLMGANSTIATYVSSTLGMLNFLNLASGHGVLIKDGGALEQLNDVDTIVFDKTGTLTIEQPHVAQIHTFSDMDGAEVLRVAAAAESRQPHPIARAILDAAAEVNLELPPIDKAHYEVGYGLKVRLVADDKRTEDIQSSPLIRVGSGRFMTMEGITLPEQVDTLAESCQDQGHSLVMVAVDDELVGCIELQPTVRPEAQKIIGGLQERGLDLYIISGDQEAPTRKLATDLGMTGYFANTLPEAKADLVEQLQSEGRQVCFIGDGINDAIALRKAQVSISLRGATTAATDTAQVILMEGNLNQLLHLFQLAEEFERNLKHNFRFTAGVSLVAASGILLAGFTFAATEIFYAVSFLGGLGIAMKPLLDHQKEKIAERPQLV